MKQPEMIFTCKYIKCM